MEIYKTKTHEGRLEFIKISKQIELCYLFSRESILTENVNVDLHNEFFRTAMCSLGLHKSFSRIATRARGSKKANFLIRGKELQSERTNSRIRGNGLLIRE